MNANAYGGQLAEVLEWVDVCTAAGSERRAPDALGFAYRSSNLGAGEVVARASFRLCSGGPRGGQGDAGGDARAAAARPSPRGSRPSARPSRTPRTSAPGGAPPGSCSRRPAAAACGSGGARFSEKHANFVENAGDGDDRRRARADGGGPPPRPRALRRRAGAGGPGAGRGRAGRGLGAVRRRLLAARRRGRPRGALAWFLAAAETTVEPPADGRRRPTAAIGAARTLSGSPPAARCSSGCRRPRTGTLPALPLAEPPKSGRLAGPVLEQARVLGAAPAALRPYIESSCYGESGVDVSCSAGIELRFGDASQAAREVAGGGGGARRSVDHRARLCRPARAQPTDDQAAPGTPFRQLPKPST